MNRYEYRVYFDEVTRDCTRKDVVLEGTEEPGPYLVVVPTLYDDIEFCAKFYVTKDFEIKRKKVDFSESTKLQLTDKVPSYRAVKDDITFRVDDAYLGDTDSWGIRGYD